MRLRVYGAVFFLSLLTALAVLADTDYRSPTVPEIRQQLALKSMRSILAGERLLQHVGEIDAAVQSKCADVNVYSTFNPFSGPIYFIYINWEPCKEIGGSDEQFSIDTTDTTPKLQGR